MTDATRPEWRSALPVVALGFTSLATQVILLRDFLAVFHGNELVIGVILGNWMILTGIGSYLGRFLDASRKGPQVILAFVMLYAFLPIVTVFLLRYLRTIIFPVGSMLGIIEVLCGSFVLLLPYCLVSGASFTVLAAFISDRRASDAITTVYAWEAVGSVIGGLAFNLLIVFFLDTFEALFLIAALDALVAALFAGARRRAVARSFAVIGAVFALAGAAFFDLDATTRRYLFPDQEIVRARDTPYGNLVVSKQANQLNFFQNSVLLGSTDDVTGSEEAVHYAMIQHPNPKRVLLISGAIAGAVPEILKYKVDQIDYVELNPWLIDLVRDFTTALQQERIQVFARDARLFVRTTSARYDVALINAPEPNTAQVNRFYTVQFFAELKEKLTPGAVVSLGLLPATDYLGEAARQVTSVICNTLKSQFSNVLIVPGLKTYILASDSALRIEIGKLIEEAGLQNTYVNPYYIDDRIMQQRSALIERAVDEGAGVNTDFTPIAYYRHVEYWLSFFHSNYWILALLCLVALAIAAFNANALSIGLFTGGLAGSGIEVLLMISFQVIYGYVYLVLGIIVTVFMAGLALGSLWTRRMAPNPRISQYISVQLVLGTYCLLLPVWLILLRNAVELPAVVHSAFVVLTLVLALIIGTEFSVASRLRRGTVSVVAAELYSIDLMGSAIGALVVTAYLIPILGILNVSLVIGFMSFFSGFVLFLRRGTFAS